MLKPQNPQSPRLEATQLGFSFGMNRAGTGLKDGGRWHFLQNNEKTIICAVFAKLVALIRVLPLITSRHGCSCAP